MLLWMGPFYVPLPSSQRRGEIRPIGLENSVRWKDQDDGYCKSLYIIESTTKQELDMQGIEPWISYMQNKCAPLHHMPVIVKIWIWLNFLEMNGCTSSWTCKEVNSVDSRCEAYVIPLHHIPRTFLHIFISSSDNNSTSRMHAKRIVELLRISYQTLYEI